MNKGLTKTDNSFLQDKIALRINNLPKQDKLKVLDCYAGDNIIWNNIKRIISNREINILKIEQKSKSGIYLKGDNIKYLKTIKINEFDIIDLDAYGIPYKQLNIILPQLKKK